MKTITIREFQTNVMKYLKVLPVTITRYNQPVAIVSPYTVTGNPQNSNALENLPGKTEPERPMVRTNNKAREVAKAIIHETKVKTPPRKTLMDKAGSQQFQLCEKHKVMHITCGCT